MFSTKLISTEFDKIKKRIVKVLIYGFNDVRTAPETGPYGVDSNPIAGMEAIYADTAARGKQVIIGYINKNQLADVGEFRIYSTDADGNLKAYAWLHNDGTMDLLGNANHVAQFEGLQSAFNQFRSDFNDLVSKYNSHIHPGVTAGGASSGVTLQQGSDSNADISGAEIARLRTI